MYPSVTAAQSDDPSSQLTQERNTQQGEEITLTTSPSSQPNVREEPNRPSPNVVHSSETTYDTVPRSVIESERMQTTGTEELDRTAKSAPRAAFEQPPEVSEPDPNVNAQSPSGTLPVARETPVGATGSAVEHDTLGKAEGQNLRETQPLASERVAPPSVLASDLSSTGATFSQADQGLHVPQAPQLEEVERPFDISAASQPPKAPSTTQVSQADNALQSAETDISPGSTKPSERETAQDETRQPSDTIAGSQSTQEAEAPLSHTELPRASAPVKATEIPETSDTSGAHASAGRDSKSGAESQIPREMEAPQSTNTTIPVEQVVAERAENASEHASERIERPIMSSSAEHPRSQIRGPHLTEPDEVAQKSRAAETSVTAVQGGILRPKAPVGPPGGSEVVSRVSNALEATTVDKSPSEATIGESTAPVAQKERNDPRTAAEGSGSSPLAPDRVGESDSADRKEENNVSPHNALQVLRLEPSGSQSAAVEAPGKILTAKATEPDGRAKEESDAVKELAEPRKPMDATKPPQPSVLTEQPCPTATSCVQRTDPEEATRGSNRSKLQNQCSPVQGSRMTESPSLTAAVRHEQIPKSFSEMEPRPLPAPPIRPSLVESTKVSQPFESALAGTDVSPDTPKVRSTASVQTYEHAPLLPNAQTVDVNKLMPEATQPSQSVITSAPIHTEQKMSYVPRRLAGPVQPAIPSQQMLPVRSTASVHRRLAGPVGPTIPVQPPVPVAPIHRPQQPSQAAQPTQSVPVSSEQQTMSARMASETANAPSENTGTVNLFRARVSAMGERLVRLTSKKGQGDAARGSDHENGSVAAPLAVSQAQMPPAVGETGNNAGPTVEKGQQVPSPAVLQQSPTPSNIPSPTRRSSLSAVTDRLGKLKIRRVQTESHGPSNAGIGVPTMASQPHGNAELTQHDVGPSQAQTENPQQATGSTKAPPQVETALGQAGTVQQEQHSSSSPAGSLRSSFTNMSERLSKLKLKRPGTQATPMETTAATPADPKSADVY